MRLLAVLLLAAASCQPHENPPEDRGPAILIVAVDVGQGASALVVGTDGSALLIDGGASSHVGAVRDAVASYAGGRVDHVVVTHWDADHVGGLADFLLGPDRRARTADDGAAGADLWDYGDDGNCTTQACERYRLSRTGRARVVELGQVLRLGDAEAECVTVNGRVAGGTAFTTTDENARSVGFLVRHGNFRALFTGDLTGGGDANPDLETPLARHTGPVDVLHVNHHGSAASTAATALAMWRPRAALVSVGEDNSYCHPAQSVLDRLEAQGARVFSTGAGITRAQGSCRATSWPPGSAVLGTVEVNAYRDGTFYVGGEQVP
jgi:competence protein ComEC